MSQTSFQGPFIGVQKNLDFSFFSKRDAEDASNVNLHLGTIKKRPGWTFGADVSVGGACLGMYEYVKLDGTFFQLVKAGSTLQKIVAAVVSQVTNGTGLSATELGRFVTINDKVYMCDGSVFKVTDGTTLYDAPIARPGSVPTLALSGAVNAGNLRGDYDYKYTFYSTAWGQESPASDVSTPLISPNNQNITVTTTTTAPNTMVGGSPVADTRVDKKRLYRRKVSASEAVWTFYKDITLATASDIDSVRDNDVFPTIICPLSLTTALPTFRHMAYQAGVLFLAGDSNDLYFTRVGQPWEVDNAITIGSSGDSDPITGLWAFQGVTIVFKRHSIWSVSGNSKETIYPRRIASGVGCSGGHTIVEVDGLLYFMGERDFYLFDGASDPIPIGDRVLTDITGRNFSRDPYAVAVHDHINKTVMWSYSGPQAATNDKIYTYFIQNSLRAKDRSWCPWNFNPKAVTSFGVFSDYSTRVREIFLGFDDGLVGKLTGSSDNGTEIAFFWRMGRFDGGSPDRVKRWGEVASEFTPQTNSSLIDVKYYLDEDAAVTLDSHNQQKPIFRKRLGTSSRHLRLEFYGNNDQPCELINWSILGDVTGRVF